MQVYESHGEIAEAREEVEVLRLKLEAAQQEAQEARKQTAAAQSGLAAALASQAPLTSRENSPAQLSPAEVCFDRLRTSCRHFLEISALFGQQPVGFVRPTTGPPLPIRTDWPDAGSFQDFCCKLQSP